MSLNFRNQFSRNVTFETKDSYLYKKYPVGFDGLIKFTQFCRNILRHQSSKSLRRDDKN